MKDSRLTRTLITLGLCASLGIWGLISPNQATAQNIIPVDCSDPMQTLAAAIQSANPGDTIQVSGTCQEMVTITTDRLTIDGQGSAIIDGGGGFPVAPITSGVVTVDGASGVHLTGLTVQNGPDGILIARGAAARLTDITCRNNADEGIQLTDTATATMEGTILSENNGDDGIGVFQTSNLSVRGGAILSALNNGDDGISVFSSSSLRISSSTVRLDNNGRLDEFGDGLQVSGTSTVGFAGSTTVSADQNAWRGMTVSSASYLYIFDTSTANLTANGDDGLGIFNLSRFSLGAGTTLNSEGNAGTGIVVSSISVAFCSSESTVIFNVNDGGPSSVSANSQASSACLGPMPVPQTNTRRRVVPEPPVEETENH